MAMSRADAIAAIKEVINRDSDWLDYAERNPILRSNPDLNRFAWNDWGWCTGFDQGIIIALCRAFDVDPSDLE